MILKDHIDLIKHIKKSRDIDSFLDNYKGVERLKIAREIEQSYPIDAKSEISDELYDSFKVYNGIQDLVLGQFIMIEQIITGKTKIPEHSADLEILKLILRPKHHKNFDNDNKEDEIKHQENILNTDIKPLYSFINYFIDDRNQVLFKDFSGVFYDSKEDEDESDSKEIKEDKTAKAVFNQQWYWYSIVRMLSGEDIHKYNDTYMLPMNTVLPEMSYLAQKNKIDSANERQQQAMRKL